MVDIKISDSSLNGNGPTYVSQFRAGVPAPVAPWFESGAQPIPLFCVQNPQLVRGWNQREAKPENKARVHMNRLPVQTF
jgi:hypothetical protein